MKGRRGIAVVIIFGLGLALLAPGMLFSAEPAGDAPGFKHLYVNGIMTGETAREFTFFKELLPGGRLSVTGQVNPAGEKVTSLELTRDGKQKWSKVKLSGDGTFKYSFRPKIGAAYNLYFRITAKGGQTNDVDGSLITVKISEGTLNSAVKETLDRLVAAYEGKRASQFMALVSEDFTGDDTLLDRAIRRDFSAFHDISIRYTLAGLVPDHKDKVSVAVNFNRSHTQVSSGSRQTDTGTATVVFKMEGGSLKLWSVKGKPLFGISG